MSTAHLFQMIIHNAINCCRKITINDMSCKIHFWFYSSFAVYFDNKLDNILPLLLYKVLFKINEKCLFLHKKYNYKIIFIEMIHLGTMKSFKARNKRCMFCFCSRESRAQEGGSNTQGTKTGWHELGRPASPSPSTPSPTQQQ